jgi:hypothetical protein
MEQAVAEPEEEESFDEEDFLANSEDSELDVTKMTARQRAAHVGLETEYMALPDGEHTFVIMDNIIH